MSYENKGTTPVTVFVTREPDRSGNWICDGTADEVQIQEAIDYVGSLGGGKVVLGRGTFVIDDNIVDNGYDNIEIQGQGTEATIIQFAAAVATQTALIALTGLADPHLDRWYLHGFTLDGNLANQGAVEHWGIYARYLDNSIFSELYIKDIQAIDGSATAGKGFDMGYLLNIRIENCDVTGIPRPVSPSIGGNGCISIGNAQYVDIHECYLQDGSTGATFWDSVNDSRMSNITCVDQSMAGIQLAYLDSNRNTADNCWVKMYTEAAQQCFMIQHSTYPENPCRYNKIIGCYAENGSKGFVIGDGGQYNVIEDCTVGGGTAESYSLDGDACENNMIANCIVSHAKANSKGLLLNGAKNNLITGMYIESTPWAIKIDANSDNNVFRDIVARNVSAGVQVIDSDGNVFEHCDWGSPSAYVMSIDGTSDDTEFIDCRGTGTITDGGVNTRFSAFMIPFVEPIVGVWDVVAPGGIEVDLATEGAFAMGVIPHFVDRIMKITVFAVGLAAPGVGNAMEIEFNMDAGQPDEAYNAEAIVVANKDSDQLDFAVNDIVTWSLTRSDDIDIDHLTGNDCFEIRVMFEVGADADIDTDALFRAVEFQYLI